VMLCSGADLAEFYETVLADVSELVDLPEDLHAPWIPHITLAYLDAQSTLADGYWATRTGPVKFDRLRLAFGGEVTDFRLGPEPAVIPTDLPAEPEPVAVAAAAGPVREAWDGPLH
jgi:hypothetical protein